MPFTWACNWSKLVLSALFACKALIWLSCVAFLSVLAWIAASWDWFLALTSLVLALPAITESCARFCSSTYVLSALLACKSPIAVSCWLFLVSTAVTRPCKALMSLFCLASLALRSATSCSIAVTAAVVDVAFWVAAAIAEFNCWTFTASVACVPAATLVNWRFNVSEPTDTVLSRELVEKSPKVTESVASEVMKLPITVEFSPVWVLLVPTTTVLFPTTLLYEPFIIESFPFRSLLTPVITLAVGERFPPPPIPPLIGKPLVTLLIP